MPPAHAADRNLFEPLDRVVGRSRNEVEFLVPLTLVKIRMFLDLRAHVYAGMLIEWMPQELVDLVRSHLLSPALGTNAEVVSDTKAGKSLKQHMYTIEAQIDCLMKMVNGSDRARGFWGALIEGSLASSALKDNHRSWVDTPGTLDLVKSKSRALDSAENKMTEPVPEGPTTFSIPEFSLAAFPPTGRQP